MTLHKIKNSIHPSLNLSWIVLVVALVGIGLFQAIPGPHILDDAYITFRYSRNINSDLGFVYNQNEQVQGSTTPLFTLVLALLAKYFGSENIPFISFMIGLIADVANTWLLYQIARYLLKNDIAAFILSMIFLFQPFRLNVARGGMETSLFITLLLLMYYCYLIKRKIYISVVLAAFVVFMRIDGLFAVVPVAIHALLVYRGKALKASLIAICLLFPWFAWAYWYFGNPLPHSIVAKMAAYQELDARSTLIFLLTFLGTGTVGPYRQIFLILPGLIVAFFLIIFGLKWIKAGHQESLVIIGYPIIYFVVMSIQGAPLFFIWYYPPLMPGLLILFFGSLLFLTGNPSSNQWFRSPVIILSLFGIALVALPALFMQTLPGWGISRDVETLYRQTSIEISSEVKNGSLVLAPDIGVIGWYLGNARIVDPIGIVSPITLKYLDPRGEGNIISMRMINDLKPDYIITREGFAKNLMVDPQFLADYELIIQKGSTSSNTGAVITFMRKQENR